MRVLENGEPYINYHIAHIRDARPGNRYDPGMTDDERRHFRNLILLCVPHHTEVDKRHPELYSIELLEAWKAEREAGGFAALQQIGTTTPDELEEDLLGEATVSIKDSTVVLGGAGGSAPGAGGGGGSVLGSGRGGDGGPGGHRVGLEGLPATAPGAGGGGAGTDVEGAYGGEGGGGGEHVSTVISADEIDQLRIAVGEGGAASAAGEDIDVALLDADGRQVRRVTADGGRAGRSGSAVRDQLEGPALRVTSNLLVHSAYISDGLRHVLGGGWSTWFVPSFPAHFDLVLAVLAEAREPGNRDTELRAEVVDEQGQVAQTATITGQYVVDDLPHAFPVLFQLRGLEAAAEALWSVRVVSGEVELASLQFRIQQRPSGP